MHAEDCPGGALIGVPEDAAQPAHLPEVRVRVGDGLARAV